jgi:hypothetical protein
VHQHNVHHHQNNNNNHHHHHQSPSSPPNLIHYSCRDICASHLLGKLGRNWTLMIM